MTNLAQKQVIFPVVPYFFEIFTCTFVTTLFRNRIAKFPRCTFETPFFQKNFFFPNITKIPFFSENYPNFLVFYNGQKQLLCTIKAKFVICFKNNDAIYVYSLLLSTTVIPALFPAKTKKN